MKYDVAGTYELTYKAVDECGNETTQTRTIIVEEPEVFKTTLFTDGTLIINESSTDRDSNIAEHGAVVSVYEPLDADNTYVFSGGDNQPWLSERSQIKSVKFGSAVAPIEMAFWFQKCINLESIDFTNCDASNVTTVRAMFSETKVTEVTLPAMPNLTSIQYLFRGTKTLTDVDFSNVGATGIINTTDCFQGCYGLTEVSLIGLAGNVDKCERMFANIGNDGQGNMNVQTIYSDGALKFWQASSSTNMFRSCTSLVGGNGTVFRSDVTNKDYARVDKADEPGYFTQA